MPVVYMIYEYVPSTYDVVKGVFCVTYWGLVIPVDTTILVLVFNIVSSFVSVDEFTNCVTFHRKISPLVIDVIFVSVKRLWAKLVLTHLSLNYISMFD